MSNIHAIVASCAMQMKQTFSRSMFRFTMIVQPLIFGSILYLMFKNTHDMMSHVIFGTGLITIWGTIVFSSASDIDRERRMGTLMQIFCVPVKFSVIMTGKIIGNIILGLFSMIISTLFLILVFHVEFKVAHIGLFILVIVIMMLSFMAISMLFATMLTLSRQARVLMNALDYPLYIICGLVFPINMLPGFIRIISYVLSPTWINELLKLSATGIHDFKDFYLKLAILTILTISYFILSILFFKKIDVKARMDATLEVV